MTTLEAINEMLEWIQQPPAPALDTGGTSDEAEAENSLDRLTKSVLKESWHVNTENGVEFLISDVKIAVSGGAGTFTYGETVTQTTSGATGTFNYIASGFMYLTALSGTWASSLNLTGGTSGATRTGGAYTAITESKIPYDTDILYAERSKKDGESRKITMRGGFFWDSDENTATFGSDLSLDIRRLLDFTDLPESLANYITKRAAMSFLKYKMPARTEGLQDRSTEVTLARIAARNDDGDRRETNVHETRRGREFLGDRRMFSPTNSVASGVPSSV